MNTCGRLWCRLLLPAFLTIAAPLCAQTEPDSTAVITPETVPPLLDTLDELSCEELEQVFHGRIPRYVYGDQTDQVYELVLYLDDRCDYGEPLGRIRILASIWDDAFDEVIYGYEVIGWLADRYDSGKQPPPDSEREVFDRFTTNFANQLLPHVPSHSLEEFFCLFYAGQTDAAWDLLQSEDLEDSWLRYYYDEEINALTNLKAPYTIGVHWGRWLPAGDLGFVGPKQLVGFTVEQWSRAWFGRIVMEFRLGRTDEPYFVSKENVSGYSDRWDAFLLGIEGGAAVWQSGPHQATVFLGLGYDAIKPFKDEDVSPATFNVNAGLGYRLHLDRGRRWYLSADGRFEFMGDRNGGGTSMGGSAFSGRLGVGMSLGRNPEPRLEALGHVN